LASLLPANKILVLVAYLRLIEVDWFTIFSFVSGLSIGTSLTKLSCLSISYDFSKDSFLSSTNKLIRDGGQQCLAA